MNDNLRSWAGCHPHRRSETLQMGPIVERDREGTQVPMLSLLRVLIQEARL